MLTPPSQRASSADYQFYLQFLPGVPGEPRPTLADAPNDMDLDTAGELLVRASRWLEFLKGQVARAEAEQLLAKQRLSKATRLAKFQFGTSVDKWSEEAVAEVSAREEEEAQAHAKSVVLKGILDGQEKVKSAASRIVSKYQRTEGGGQQWTP